ncbi:hypothetical protein D3C72_1464880 [compost metagenome]
MAAILDGEQGNAGAAVIATLLQPAHLRRIAGRARNQARLRRGAFDAVVLAPVIEGALRRQIAVGLAFVQHDLVGRPLYQQHADLAALLMVLHHGFRHRRAHRGDGGELLRQLGRQAQGKETATRQARRIDPFVIDTVILLEFAQHGLRETDVIRARQVIHAEAHVPVLLDALRIHNDELVPIRSPVHLRVQHLFRHAHAAAMEIEDDGKGLLRRALVRRRRVDDVAALVFLVDEAAHLGQRGCAQTGQGQQADGDFHGLPFKSKSSQHKQEQVKSW